MSGSGFHVHGPHDHELHHARENAAHHDPFAAKIALVTALLAVLAANFSYFSGASQASAIIFKNNAAKSSTDAADRWAYYQAKGTKQQIAEIAILLGAGNKEEELKARIAQYETDRQRISAEARKFEQDVKDWDKKSEDELHSHHLWAQATTALQIAISVAAVALVARQKWLLKLVLLFAGFGMIIAGVAIFH